jgi:hypothetical protein
MTEKSAAPHAAPVAMHRRLASQVIGFLVAAACVLATGLSSGPAVAGGTVVAWPPAVAPGPVKEYKITITGNLNKSATAASLFGLTSATTPISIVVNVDTSLGNISTLPAGVSINPADTIQYKFTTNLTFIPISAIKSLSLAIGNATWSAADVAEAGLYDKFFGLLLSGDLVNNSNSATSILLSNDQGEVTIGQIDCVGTTCKFLTVGEAASFAESRFGTISGVIASIMEVAAATPETKLQELWVFVNGSTASANVKNLLNIQINLAQSALRKGQKSVALIALNGIIHTANLFKNKGLSAAETNVVVAKAQEAIALVNAR